VNTCDFSGCATEYGIVTWAQTIRRATANAQAAMIQAAPSGGSAPSVHPASAGLTRGVTLDQGYTRMALAKPQLIGAIVDSGWLRDRSGLSLSTISRMNRLGEIPGAFRSGKGKGVKWRYRRAILEEWLAGDSQTDRRNPK